MKIAIFTDVLLEVPGGIGSSISAIKSALEAAGHQVLVFAPGWPPKKPAARSPYRDPNLVVVPTLKFFHPNGAPWARRPSLIAKWIERERPELADFDLFHAHYEGPTSIAAIELARKWGKPLLQTLHGREDQALAHNIPLALQPLVAVLLDALHSKSLRHIDRQYPPKKAKNHHPNQLRLHPKLAPNRRRAHMWHFITRQGNAADLVIAPAEHFAEKLQTMGLKTPIKILGNGINDDIVPISPTARAWLPPHPLKLLWNSRLSREKRFLPLLEALKIAGDHGLNYELIAFGTGNDRKAAEKFIRRHQLNVKLMGSASRQRILSTSTHCHLAVITSHDFDVHSLILVEAEACGTPLLICDPDMVKSLVPGSFVLTDTPSPAAIARALLSLTPNQIATMSRTMLTSRSRVYQSARLAELLSIYQSVLK